MFRPDRSSCPRLLALAVLALSLPASGAGGEALSTPEGAGPGLSDASVVCPTTLAGTSTNSVEVVLVRLDDAAIPDATAHLSIAVHLPGVPSVTNVRVFTGNGTLVLLGFDGQEWGEELYFASISEAKVTANGTWSIHIGGPGGATPSVSTFALNANGIDDADIFATPAVTAPVDGGTVPPCAEFAWSPPATGPFPAYGLGAYLEYRSLGGGATEFLDQTLTAWDPPGDLLNDAATFTVAYFALAPLDLIGPLIVTSGSIVWGNSPLAPPGYPDATPFVTLAGAAAVSFTVGSQAPEDLTCDGHVSGPDLGVLLGDWGGAGPGDINSDGTVNGADLGMLLGAWTG